VLAPDVNFFLNSRKQGLPCQRSLFFSFLHTSLNGVTGTIYNVILNYPSVSLA